jgi:hypothetical protein
MGGEMGDFSRRPWEPEDEQKLLDLWNRVMSITLIALELRRTTSSVQTMASRKGCLRRTEGNERHRRKWMPEDIQALEDSLVKNTDRDGYVLICEIADEVGRSIDAVATRLIDFPQFGSEEALFEVIKVTRKSFGTTAPSRYRATSVNAWPTPDGGQKMPCMTCAKIFYSDSKATRMCSNCKKDEGGSDWDY